jgi:hypothetical protein
MYYPRTVIYTLAPKSVLGPLLPPTSRLGEIVPLGDSQMERLRKKILLGVIEAIALRGII